jgi:hypothetical protein
VAGATEFWSNATMMGLTDRLGPWARRFQRTDAIEPAAETARVRASLRARHDDDGEPLERRTGRFFRGVLQEQER